MRKMVESLVVEFDQGESEEFLSLGSTSPKTIRQYRKVSSETHSRMSSEFYPKVAYTSAYNASVTTSNEVLKISCATHAAHVNVSQESRRVNTLVHDHNDCEDKSRHHSPL